DTRSLNSAALNAGVPMMAAELGGGGGTDPIEVSHALAGLKRCLACAGIIKQTLPTAPPSIFVETRSIADNIYAPLTGLF